MKQNKKGGGKMSRSEILQMRVDPRLRFAIELIAKKQKRTASNMMEIALELYLSTHRLDETKDRILDISNKLYHDNAVERFINVAQYDENLLSADELIIWNFIQESPVFWNNLKLNKVLVNLAWEQLQNYVSTKNFYWELLSSKIIADKVNNISDDKILEFNILWKKMFPD